MFAWMKNLQLSGEPTICDIGANIGLFSLAYASIFKSAKVHSFEPVPYIFKELLKNLQYNPELQERITAYNYGLSNRNETQFLSIPTSNQHERYDANYDNRLYSILGQGNKKIKANLKTLDNWHLENDIGAIDFIKIDVEGYEYFVLEGASKILSNYRPAVIFELNQLTLTLADKEIEDYLYFAKEHNYDVFGLEYGYKQELLRIENKDQVRFISDLILLQKTL